jgi:ParB-like chromosome segregation protein Spo0J
MSIPATLSYVEEIVPIEKLKVDDEFKSLVPPNNMREELASSIRKNGQLIPLDVDLDYIVLDGHTRAEILKELKYDKVKVRKWNFSSKENRALAYTLIMMLNLERRHLPKNEVLRLLREISEKIEGVSKERQTSEQNLARESGMTPATLEQKMKRIKDEIGVKDVTDDDIKRYSIISTIPFLRQLVDEGKISLRTAYELYTKAKDKLQKINDLPKYEREQLLTTKEGRKILLERDDLLQQILDHKLAVSQAINQIKIEKKQERSKKKPKAKEALEDEEEESIGGNDTGESEEIDLLSEWQKALEEEKAKTEQLATKPSEEIGEAQTKFRQIFDELQTKGFAELPFEVDLVKIGDKCYMINHDALLDLEQGNNKWSELSSFLSKNGVILPGDAEGTYVIPWKLLGRCVAWKSH